MSVIRKYTDIECNISEIPDTLNLYNIQLNSRGLEVRIDMGLPIIVPLDVTQVNGYYWSIRAQFDVLIVAEGKYMPYLNSVFLTKSRISDEENNNCLCSSCKAGLIEVNNGYTPGIDLGLLRFVSSAYRL